MKTRPSNPSLYAGNRNASLSEPLVKRYGPDTLLRGLLPVRSGIFEKAVSHWIHRPKGIDSHLLMLCLGGKGWVRKGRTEFLLGRGEWILLKANEAHEYGADDKDPWTIYWTHFIGKDCERYFELLELETRSIKRSVEDPELLRSLRANLENVVTAYESGFGYLECLRAAEALRGFFLNVAFGQAKNHSPSKDSSLSTMESVITKMRERLNGEWSLVEMAASVPLSVTHFSRLFRSTTGFSPTDFFLRLKIQRASQKLLSTGSPIREVARELGFEDEYYFSRLFRKITGESPRKYRESHRT